MGGAVEARQPMAARGLGRAANGLRRARGGFWVRPRRGEMGVEREVRRVASGAGCVVSAEGPATAPARGGPRSCSGVTLSRSPGLVLCHGGLLAAFLEAPGEGAGPYVPAPPGPDVRLRVRWANAAAASPRGARAAPADLLGLLRCPAFAAACGRLLKAGPAEPWAAGEEEEEEEAARWLGWFALLRVPEASVSAAVSAVSVVPVPERGAELLLCGCPFGALCPDLFLNTLSRGVLSNRAGPLLLSDARCLPGTEGGAAWAGRDPGALAALVAAPLRARPGGGPLGLALLCAARPLLHAALAGLPPREARALRALLTSDPGTPQEGRHHRHRPHHRDHHRRAVLVACGPAWGSGLAWAPRLVLTCRHVVAHGTRVQVRPRPPKSLEIHGRVVFATRDTSPYDVAVLELEEDLPEIPAPVLADRFQEGEDVSVVGFGVFGQACGPLVTAGILSAVVTVGEEPVMLQTTCAVHSGSSGGPVFATDSGQLLGIVASNTRDNSTGATYPHLNFSIPITVLQPALREYLRTGDPASLDPLNRADERVRRVWRLQRTAASQPHSRL
ncbi:peroxisomal leader peptide-processing protease [Tachyglossus aculeatus]|uniref:peroxisomal leader peptide-processing protease n=1 Tax=Tachyglossus aculeatus TaxID=9261 RepID=UPI0018F33459|nr:peroxisomal leader peptide-processing protease [Tachyglossus aculeatus]